MTPQEQHAALVTYLRAKLEQGDWHGVRDAAIDIEILETRMDCFRDTTIGPTDPTLKAGTVTWVKP
jgi:hypothetical protein